MALQFDHAEVSRAGREVQRAQEEWAVLLESHRPQLSPAVFGAGLAGPAAELVALMEEAHSIRVAHARRLAAGAAAAVAQADAMAAADGGSGSALGGA